MERPVAIAGGGREIRVLVTVLLPAPIRRVLRPCSGAGSPSPDRRHRAPRADRQDPAHPAPGRRPRRPVEAGNSTVTNRPIRRSTPPAPGRRPPTALPAPCPPPALRPSSTPAPRRASRPPQRPPRPACSSCTSWIGVTPLKSCLLYTSDAADEEDSVD